MLIYGSILEQVVGEALEILLNGRGNESQIYWLLELGHRSQQLRLKSELCNLECHYLRYSGISNSLGGLF